jgi:hypothetical protein
VSLELIGDGLLGDAGLVEEVVGGDDERLAALGDHPAIGDGLGAEPEVDGGPAVLANGGREGRYEVPRPCPARAQPVPVRALVVFPGKVLFDLPGEHSALKLLTAGKVRQVLPRLEGQSTVALVLDDVKVVTL